ncbi:MAG: DUF4442 domain-containing protein [Flavobacteriaceae bacterium]|nr:DUF4442 domain-containing protein [Flavobacteriaceae bacterium]
MMLTPFKINLFNLLKLPAAYFTGVRVKAINDTSCTVAVTYKWINQNPFKSMFWAVQGMAAELTTGALVLGKIKDSGHNISMLVANNNASFSKKAVGQITFNCNEGHKIDQAIDDAIRTKEGQTVWLNSKGVNTQGIQVSDFNFQWTIKLKS